MLRQVSARLLVYLVKNCLEGRIKHVFDMEAISFSHYGTSLPLRNDFYIVQNSERMHIVLC